MSDKITKVMSVTPLTVETKELLSKKTGEPYQKVEITCELPSAGKVWMKAWPEDVVGIAPGVPFDAEVTATPRDNGGYFYDFKALRAGVVPKSEAPKPIRSEEPRTISDADAIRTLSLSLHAKLEQEFARINQKLDALAAEKELADLTGGAIANGF